LNLAAQAFGFGAFGRVLNPSKWSDMKRSAGEDHLDDYADEDEQWYENDYFNPNYFIH